MPVYQGILKALSGGAHQTSAYDASHDWVRLEFITIGDERIRDIRMQNYHYELLKTEIGKDVAVSVFTGPIAYSPGDQRVVVATRLSDGSIERMPDTFSKVPVVVIPMFVLTLIWLGLGAAGLYFGIQWLAIGGFALAVIWVLNLLWQRSRAGQKSAKVLASIRALDRLAPAASR